MSKKIWVLHVTKNGVQNVYFFSSRNKMKMLVRHSAALAISAMKKNDDTVEKLDVKNDTDKIYSATYTAYDGAELITSMAFKGKLCAVDEQVLV